MTISSLTSTVSRGPPVTYTPFNIRLKWVGNLKCRCLRLTSPTSVNYPGCWLFQIHTSAFTRSRVRTGVARLLRLGTLTSAGHCQRSTTQIGKYQLVSVGVTSLLAVGMFSERSNFKLKGQCWTGAKGRTSHQQIFEIVWPSKTDAHTGSGRATPERLRRQKEVTSASTVAPPFQPLARSTSVIFFQHLQMPR